MVNCDVYLFIVKKISGHNIYRHTPKGVETQMSKRVLFHNFSGLGSVF